MKKGVNAFQNVRLLKWSAEKGHRGGVELNAYVGQLREQVDAWIEAYQKEQSTLRYMRGPGFLKILDRRAGLENSDYMLDELHSQIYLAFEDGASIEEAMAALSNEGLAVERRQIEDMLAEFLEARLMFEEGARYLAVALPTNPRRFDKDLAPALANQPSPTPRQTIPYGSLLRPDSHARTYAGPRRAHLVD